MLIVYGLRVMLSTGNSCDASTPYSSVLQLLSFAMAKQIFPFFFSHLTLCAVAAATVFGCATGGDTRHYTKDSATDAPLDGNSAGAAGGYVDVGPGSDVLIDVNKPVDVDSDADWCGGELTKAEPLPLVLYIMLDSSGSMSHKISSTRTKWQAVTDSLKAFIADPTTSNLYVGLQFFPFMQPDIPKTCATNDACKAFGPCTQIKICDNFYSQGTIRTCNTPDDCVESGNTGNCYPRGICSGDPTKICLPEYEGACRNNLGDCLEEPKFCEKRQSCEIADYATPIVPVGPRATVESQIKKALDERELDGATPTGPALAGAISYLQQHLNKNPDHRPAVLLVTDGLPTDCTPSSIADVAKVAADAAPKIITYVIGVFEDEVAATAQTNLNAIAAAGQTTNAYVIRTSEDIVTEFTKSLDKIREHRVACQYAIPTPTEGPLVYNLVNVEISFGDTTSQTVGYVPNIAACTKGGWYYDLNPDEGKTPTQIHLCPDTCKAVQGKAGASVAVRLGCPTIVIK